MRTTLPTLTDNLRPRWPNLEETKQKDGAAKFSYTKFYNRRYSTRPLPTLKNGDRVRVKTDKKKTWSDTGTIIETVAKRSYLVNTPQGTYRRNRRHLQVVPK